jgi:hypothetical protein
MGEFPRLDTKFSKARFRNGSISRAGENVRAHTYSA